MIRRKALVADAAAMALADPTNPYAALRKFLDVEVYRLEQADADVVELTEQLMSAELKGRWHNRDASALERQTRLRDGISLPTVDRDARAALPHDRFWGDPSVASARGRRTRATGSRRVELSGADALICLEDLPAEQLVFRSTV